MTYKSQTIDEVLKESKDKIAYTPIHEDVDSKAFDQATKLEPSLYLGQSRAYRSQQLTESFEKIMNRMRQKSGSLKDWIGQQHSEVEKNVSRGYDFSFENVALQYLQNEGEELMNYLHQKGRDFYNITRIGRENIDAVAGLAMQGDEAALIASYDFEEKVAQLASHYGIPTERAAEYVMAHELTHASQKGKYFDDPIIAELDVEGTLKEYFTQKGYGDLAAIADDRAKSVSKNYGSLGTSNIAYEQASNISAN